MNQPVPTAEITKPMPRSICLSVLFAFLAISPSTRAEEPKPGTETLVSTQAGQLPIILSAPHGGELAVPGVPVRTGDGIPKGPSGFVTVRDGGTEQLAIAIAAELEQRMGKKPYYVVARFSRKYIDPNRPAPIAYEHPEAKPIYDFYHGTLAKFAREVHTKFDRGLVLDIHGQGSARDTIFRGTQNGKTVALLTQRFGPEAQVGPKSFFGLLMTAGCKGFPLDDSAERQGFGGGFIVQSYGGTDHFGLDAIQLEFGADFRARENVKASAAKVADAVVSFVKLYLSEPKQQ